MAKRIDSLSIEELDSEIEQRGKEITRLREENRKFLDARDALVAKENEQARQQAATDLGG